MIHAPGNDFATMANLVNDNGSDNPLVTDQLLIAIFWEESLFNNIKQPGGTAIGFGQIEPSELKRMNASGDIHVDVGGVLSDPEASVNATAQVLEALFSKLGKPAGLRGYAGYGFKNDASWKAARQAIINGWTSCEQALLNISSNILDAGDDPDAVIAALRKSRPFGPDAPTSNGVTWRDALFPPEP